tara:strand:- start:170 stop:418 length:249 start_codon:yes stop_codon:yes gene_type:complete
MLLRIRLLTMSISITGLLVFVLCIGSQNLRDRKNIELGITSTATFPTGFIVGSSIVLGFLSGSTTAISLMPKEVKINKNSLD